MLINARRLLLAVVMLSAAGFSKPRELDPRLKDVRSVFVRGNSEVAEHARNALSNGSCLKLAGNAEGADAVLDIAADTSSEGRVMGGFGARNWIASATLTLKAGDLIWSKSTRQQDAPFVGGGKSSGKLLVAYLKKDVGCK